MAKSKVYFTRTITPEKMIEMYKLLGIDLPGKVAVKVHSGEQGNKNYLGPDFMKPMIDYVDGTVVECNTAYEGARNTTEKHLHLIHDHKWDVDLKFDLLDAEGPDLELDVPNGHYLKKNYVGKNLANYDSLLVLSHFKGHAMGGYGGALKQLSIGCGSAAGKAYIHTAAKTKDVNQVWDEDKTVWQDIFMASMADAASSVAKMFEGKAAYINVMKNMSVDCDCDGNAAPPCMKDIGILASLDPVAVDRACLDLVENSDDPGKEELLERINSRHGMLTPIYAEELGTGSRDYELVEVK